MPIQWTCLLTDIPATRTIHWHRQRKLQLRLCLCRISLSPKNKMQVTPANDAKRRSLIPSDTHAYGGCFSLERLTEKSVQLDATRRLSSSESGSSIIAVVNIRTMLGCNTVPQFRIITSHRFCMVLSIILGLKSTQNIYMHRWGWPLLHWRNSIWII